MRWKLTVNDDNTLHAPAILQSAMNQWSEQRESWKQFSMTSWNKGVGVYAPVQPYYFLRWSSELDVTASFAVCPCYLCYHFCHHYNGSWAFYSFVDHQQSLCRHRTVKRTFYSITRETEAAFQRAIIHLDGNVKYPEWSLKVERKNLCWPRESEKPPLAYLQNVSSSIVNMRLKSAEIRRYSRRARSSKDRIQTGTKMRWWLPLYLLLSYTRSQLAFKRYDGNVTRE